MSRDTLLLVTTSYPESGDGSEAAGAFVADLAAEMGRSVPVRVVAPGAHAGMRQDAEGVSVRRFAAAGRPLSLLSPAQPADWLAIISTLHSMRAQTFAAAADGRVAHTLALWALPSGWAAAGLKRQRGIPYSIWALGSDIWSLGKVPGVRGMLRRVIRGATHCYADGLQLGEDAARIGGRPFQFLPSTRQLGGARTRPPASAPPYRLLFLGRWHPNKGIDLLLDALDLLDATAWARIAEVHIAGGGPLEDLVRDRCCALQSAGRPVRLDGFLDSARAADAIAQADWLLIPSRIESIPVVFSDAMKLGCPVIATPVGDLPKLLVNDAVGVLADGTAAVDIARAITRALAREPRSLAWGLEAMADRFDLRAGVAAPLLRAMMPSCSPESRT